MKSEENTEQAERIRATLKKLRACDYFKVKIKNRVLRDTYHATRNLSRSGDFGEIWTIVLSHVFLVFLKVFS